MDASLFIEGKDGLIGCPKLDNRDIVFGMMVCHESPELIARCIEGIRAAYPTSPIVIILDGAAPTVELAKAIDSRAFIIAGAPLKKGIENGCALWTRFFDAVLAFNCEYSVKLDPDTRVHGPLTLYPVPGKLLSAGSLMSKGYEAQHVQGGFQLFTRQFAEWCRVESASIKYADKESWRCGQSEVFVSRNLVSTDYTLRAMTRNIGGGMIEHPQMDCRSVLGARPFRADALVTHPHKKP